MTLHIDPSLDHQDARKFQEAEQQSAHLTSPWKDLFVPQPPNQQSVTIVGAGIQGIMAAYLAKLHGYDVTLVDRNPDPRTATQPAEGATFGGEDSRYVTIFEGHPYLRLAGYTEAMYPHMEQAFMTAAREGGWLAKSPAEFSPLVQEWITEKLNAQDDQEKIKKLFADYIQENRVSMQLWYEFMRQNPELHDCIWLNDKIIRLYDNEELFRTACASHDKEGVLLKTLSGQELAEEYPAYAPGVANGFLVGALTMEGLTFRVQEVCRYLLDELERMGTNFAFNTEADAFLRNGDNAVTGIQTKDGRTLTSNHYALYTGAYADPKLYEKTPVHGKVAGVEGYWIEWKNVSKTVLEGMKHLPNKIHGGTHERDGMKRPVVDLNINVVKEADGSHTLRIGSGYVGVGQPPFLRDEAAKEETYKDIRWVLDKIYGEAYRAADNAGNIQNSDKVCVRSWTADDAQLQHFEFTRFGAVVSYHGGGNTGSTNNAIFEALSFLKLIESIPSIEEERTRDNINAALRKQGIHYSLASAENAPGGLADLAAAVLKNTLTDNRGIEGLR